jgi:signal transduction histidine kinase
LDDTENLRAALEPVLANGCALYTALNSTALFNEIRSKHIAVLIVNLSRVTFNLDAFMNWMCSYQHPLECILVSKGFTEDQRARNVAGGAFDCLSEEMCPNQLSISVRHAFDRIRRQYEFTALKRKYEEQSAELMAEKDLKIALLYEASKITGSVFHLETLLKMIIRLIATTIKVNLCSVMLVNEETGLLEIKEAIGLGDEIIRTTNIKKGDGISGWVYKEGTSLLIKDIEDDGRFSQQCEERYFTKSLLSVPLKINDKVIGVLNVNNKLNGKPFTEEDRKVLEPLAVQVAMIIENAELIDHLTTAKTEMKKAQDQLIRSEKFAAIGKLAASLSHEINNPLTSIYGRIQQLLRGAKDDETARLLTIVKGEVERISRILSNLLNFAKITKTKTQLSDLHALIENSLNLLQSEIKKSNISLQKDYDKKLPHMLIDGDQFMQVVINIFLNAIKAMPGGGTLSVRTEQDVESIRIIIKDTGVGIDKRGLENIFDPFYTGWENGSGTGLGLSVSKDIIENFGGDIDVASSVGSGSVFTINLPYKI